MTNHAMSIFDRYSIVSCTNCKTQSIVYCKDADEDMQWECCSAPSRQTKNAREYDAGDYLSLIEDILEGANWHSAIGLPREIIARIGSILSDEELLCQVTKVICEAFYHAI